jgi:hypothetical protein
VQSGEHQLAGLRGRESQRDGLEVAHLADQDHVRVLTQRPAKGIGERLRVHADLALVDQRLLRAVNELDRVLDRDDRRFLSLVDVVDHCGEGRRLAATGRAGDEHESTFALADILQHRRHTEVVEGDDVAGDYAKDRRLTSSREEDVDPEASHVAELEGEVDVELLLEDPALRVVHDVERHRVHFVSRERWMVDALDVSVDAEHRRLAAR